MKLKTTFLSLIILLIVTSSIAQEIWSTQQGDLKIYPISHASMVWEWNGLSIYIDPVGEADSYKQFAAPDIILITHSHGDHLYNPTLEGINAENATFIVTQDVADKINEKFKDQLTILINGENSEFKDIEIECVPAYNYPITEKMWHPKAIGNGYILTLGGKRIYISGDTGNIPEMHNFGALDLAFLSMNLPYTMDINQAAKASLILQPKVLYPYHYRGKDGFSDLDKLKSLLAKENTAIEVRVLDWYSK